MTFNRKLERFLNDVPESELQLSSGCREDHFFRFSLHFLKRTVDSDAIDSFKYEYNIYGTKTKLSVTKRRLSSVYQYISTIYFE